MSMSISENETLKSLKEKGKGGESLFPSSCSSIMSSSSWPSSEKGEGEGRKERCFEEERERVVLLKGVGSSLKREDKKGRIG